MKQPEEQDGLETGLLDINDRSDTTDDTAVTDEVDEHVNMLMEHTATQYTSEGLLPSVFLRMPNTAFGIPMGLAGHAIMYRALLSTDFDVTKSETAHNLFWYNLFCFVMEFRIHEFFWWSACVVFLVVLVCYVYKACLSFPLVRDEYLNEVRSHFFNAPNLVFMMLLLGLPFKYTKTAHAPSNLRIAWGFAFAYQLLVTTSIYQLWMFSLRSNFTSAKPQFLLSTVGWFLLAALGETAKVEEEWGIALPTFCFGAGIILYLDLLIFIFIKLHENQGLKGSPAMFLLIAPPSVGVIFLDLLDKDHNEFPSSAKMLLGWVLMVLILLLRLGPNIYKAPSVFGEYWAYVFPVTSAAASCIRYADTVESNAAIFLAVMVSVLAIFTLLAVLVRMSVHVYHVACTPHQQWRDPLFTMEKYGKGCFVSSLLRIQEESEVENPQQSRIV